jgi:predicted ATPase/signal transduction histidine kinase/tRNA A-37 threonylcarbamoyl transferase component Bud32
MIPIPGHQILDKLFDSYSTSVYRTYDEYRKCSVIVKILKGEYPKSETVASLKREYEILKGMNIEGVIKVLSLEKYNNRLAMVMEDFGGESMEKILDERSISIEEFLKLSISLTEILGEIHKQNIIHKDINPSNILWNSKTGQVKIIDFGISTVLPRELASAQNPNILEGTLPYMSPERTGRMNRMIDYRTDFYSLGVTFYKMLTGQLPFKSTNAMELVHCHIAKDPIPPYQLRISSGHTEQKGIETLSGIILKLMAKNAEERYQSIFGLKTDLGNCLEQLHTTGRIKEFEIAARDFSNRFQIPQKLYGREQEINELISCLNRVCLGTKEMMMISGNTGIGKSALVNDIHKTVVAKRGFFITGKFDQFKRCIPYSSLIQAFLQLIRQILTENEELIGLWRTKILDSVYPNGQVIIDVIPEVELIIGKQPPVPELPSQESQNRFNIYFKNFIRAFANEGNPLTIFLDDLQWIDLPSLNLIELFMTDTETSKLFFIGAFRDNEVDNSHPLNVTLGRLKKAGIKISYSELSSLDYINVNQLIADTLKCLPEKTNELSRLCMKKTNGNPFFLKQFLQTIYENQLFEFDNKQMIWHWEIGKIEKMKVTDNVVDLMITKIQKLSANTQAALKLASSIGNQFDLKTLSIVSEKAQTEAAADLWEALRDELIFPLNDDYKFIVSDFDNSDAIYKFSHDRIQHAVYTLIPEKERKEIHLKIGRLLLNNVKEHDLEEKIFNITNQLNSGLRLIESQPERNELARLNFIAGEKAKAANAYEIAFQYYTVGKDLLDDNCWQNQYSLTLKIYTEAAEASYLTGNFEMMDELATEVLKNSRSLLDRIRVNEIIIQSLMSRARLREAVTNAIDILKQLGVNIPDKPERIKVFFSILRMRLILSRYSLEDLNSLPEMKDEQKLAAMRILMSAASSAFRVQTLKVIMMILKMVQLSLKYGNSPFSPYGYGTYAVVSLGVIGNITQGYRIGKFSLDLNSRFKTREYNSKLISLFNLFIRHWKERLKDTVDPLMTSFQVGLETGDLEFAAYSVMYSCVHSLFCGNDLELVDKEMDKYIEVIKKLKQERSLYNMKMHRQLGLNLMGYCKERTLLTGSSFNEEEMLPFLINADDKVSMGTFYTDKTIVCYLYGQKQEALRYALVAESFKEPMVGLIYISLLYYYNSLIFLSLPPDTHWIKRIFYLSKVYLNQRRMKKWAFHAPENHLHKWYLVEAEKSRILRRDKKAREYYNKAIVLARNNGFINDEAHANELTAKYFLGRGDETSARNYMVEARYLYLKWGAKGIVKYLDEKYPYLFSQTSESDPDIHRSSLTKLSASGGTTTEKLDLEALQTASLTISSEIHLEKLLERLLRILITNAGAEKGYILLKEDEKLYIEGEAFADNENIRVMRHIPVTESMDVAQVVINYVFRTKETVAIYDAVNDELFNNDDYIVQHRPKSVFCMPLIYQNRLSGILYLENNHIPGAFTSERVGILKLISAQIVISTENAMLYRNLEAYNRTLEENVARRTAEISLKNELLNRQKEELNITLENLKQSQFQLVQSEKMASLGQLVAGIAHEINNPVTFISAGVDSLRTNLDEVGQVLDMYHMITPVNVEERLKQIENLKSQIDYRQTITEINTLIDSIKTGTDRTTEIIKGLRTFSHLDEDVVRVIDIHDNINSTLVLLRNKYKNRIKIEKVFADIPQIECYPGQLNQVFMNILSNAIDSIEEKGTITIQTTKSNGSVKISIRDTGKGIPENIRSKIFEPFFTTKEVGQGTGLGLSISHGIIEKHKGSIELLSEIGLGSEFIIILPVKQEMK